MKRIAVLFTQAAHGSSAGREGLDALLALSALTTEIVVFFISDGVLQLLPDQQPGQILARDYIATFGLLPLYDIDRCYVCATALQQRGITATQPLILPVIPLSAVALRQRLATCELILTF